MVTRSPSSSLFLSSSSVVEGKFLHSPCEGYEIIIIIIFFYKVCTNVSVMFAFGSFNN